jgi:hypothetical protein
MEVLPGDILVAILLRARRPACAASRALVRAGDEAGVVLLGRAMGVSQSAAHRMARDMGSWQRATAWATRVTAVTAQPGVVVAGSAALYVERLRAGHPTGFVPGDIDAWADSGCAADGALDALARLPLSSGFVEIQRLDWCDYMRYTGSMFTWPPKMSKHPSAVPKLPVQIVSIKSAPGVMVQVIASAHRDTNQDTCSCDPRTEGCSQCLSGTTADGYSVPPWPPGAPQRRFDLDGPCCALTSVDTVVRTAGSATGPEIQVLAPGVWWAGDDPTSVEPERLYERLLKYARRGYTRPVVADEMTICGDVRPTPAAIREVVERIRREFE